MPTLVAALTLLPQFWLGFFSCMLTLISFTSLISLRTLFLTKYYLLLTLTIVGGGAFTDGIVTNFYAQLTRLVW
jgi:hypothetical protein